VYIIHVHSAAYTQTSAAGKNTMELYTEDSQENSLTEKQAKVLKFIEARYLDSGTSPTY
jgi:hypothetical protein